MLCCSTKIPGKPRGHSSRSTSLSKMGVGSSKNGSTGVIDAPLGINLSSFEYIDETGFGIMAIGKGGFGLVSVMRLKTPKGQPEEYDQLFAVKAMNKMKLLAKDQVENTLNELRILSRLSKHHPNVVNLSYAFQDSRFLYAALDLCLGGSLGHALSKAPGEKFHVSRAKHYMAELTVGLRFLHSERIAHRDIKPDNILIDMKGRIRISDFNVSIKVPLGKLGSELPHQDGWGTRGYRAPEIYVRKGAGRLFSCDWWSAGATFFEMLTGEIPYPIRDGEAPVDMLRRVYNGNFDVDKLGTEQDLKDFVRGLLMFEPRDRLDDDSIIAHPFMRDVDFVKLEKGDIRPPWDPSAEVVQTTTGEAGMSSSKQRQRKQSTTGIKLDLAPYAKNFDVKLDERERMRMLNSNLGAFGFEHPEGEGDESGGEYDGDHSVCTLAQQALFSIWSFNVHAPELSPKALREDEEDEDADRLPRFALLQSVSALQTPEEVRGFVARTDDATLFALIHEMKNVHEALLAENAKFIQAEMRCDDLSRELVKERRRRDDQNPGSQNRDDAVIVAEEEINEI